MLTPWDPLGYKVGHFRQARRLALAGTQAAGPLWEFRWGSAGSLCFVTRVLLKGYQNAAMTAQEIPLSLSIARSFTAVDSVNTASILRTGAGNRQKLNTAFTNSVLSNFVESNSATVASGGTYTLDTDPISIGGYSTVATPTIDGGPDDLFNFEPFLDGDQTLRLNANEGFVISLGSTLSGAAGMILFMEVNWVEATKAPTP